jgi:RimJ/RimL family protein N-acetyltransferase
LSELTKRYPCEIDCQGSEVTISLLKPEDKSELLAFAGALPTHDLLFLSRDIQQPRVIAAWIKSIEEGEIVSVVARKDGEIAGTTAVVTDKHSWSSHVGELRVLIGLDSRDIGLGRQLIQESFLIGIDLGLEKLTARMTVDQDSAIKVFEEMGFRTEALLKDHVKDRDGIKHDIIILSHDVDRLQAQMQAYGLDEAF